MTRGIWEQAEQLLHIVHGGSVLNTAFNIDKQEPILLDILPVCLLYLL
jgi:hypothetical protein